MPKDFDEEIRRSLGIHEGLIPVSVGLEKPEAIAEDFLQTAE